MLPMLAIAEPAILSALKEAASSSLAATLSAFALILILARLRVPLAASILAGAVALGLLYGRGAIEVARMTLLGAVEPRTIGLVIVVTLMLALSEAMRRSGQLDEIVRLAKSFLRRPAVTMAALPALIGLMPMPGGAQLSAPMVESAAGQARVSRARLSAINYWFRHIWEHWWPLYPGVMVAMSVTRSDVGQFIACQWPLGAIMAISGIWLFRKSHPELHRTGPRAPAGHARKLLRATSTIWVILLVWAGARALLNVVVGRPPSGSLADVLRRYLPLTAGLVVSFAWTIRMNRLAPSDVAAALKRKSIYKLALVVVTVMIFWYAIRHVDAAGKIAVELAELRVPVGIVVALLPLIAGMVTGLAVGFVGASFPIVLAMVEQMPDHGSIRPYIALAYAFGHLGQMVSPLHLCQVVSNEYFGADSRAVYRRLLVPAVLTGAVAIGYFWLLKALLG